MKRIAIFGLALQVAACTNPAPMTQANGNAATGATAMSEPKSGSGEGSITAIDPGTGKISLAHGPVAELNWPAMTMGFTAKDGQLGGLKVGDKVKFTFRWDGKSAEIESIDKL